MDAMNHQVASPQTNQLDLSNAAFKFYGDDADIDNPFVPNMVRVRAGTGFFGRGYPISPDLAYVLVLPSALIALDLSSIASLLNNVYFPVYLAPRYSILDVFSTLTNSQESEVIRCAAPFLSPVFERDASSLSSYTHRQAIRRKSLGFAPSGIELLQRTRTSSRDLEYAEPLRRSLNK